MNLNNNFTNNSNSQRNSTTLTLEDNDLLDDEWLYTSESFSRTDTFRRNVKTKGDASRDSILEWLATDDDKAGDIPTDNNSVNLDDINSNKRKTDSLNLFDENYMLNNSNSLFDDDMDISNLDSRFMGHFKLVSQDDFEDTEVEELLTKNNASPELHQCDSPNTEINLIDSNKLGNNETINIEDNDSDSNLTIINSSNKNKIEGLNEVEKNTEIVKVDNLEVNKLNEKQNFEQKENKQLEFNTNLKSDLLKKSELAQKRFLAKVEEAKRTLENLKPRKELLTSEKELNLKTPKLEENKNHDNNKKDESYKNKKKIERRSYYYYADTGSDDEKDDHISSIRMNDRKNSFDHSDYSHSGSLKKTYNYFNSGGADSSFYGDSFYNTNESSFISTSSTFSLPSAQLGNRYSEDFEDYPRKPPAPSAPSNGNILTNLMDHPNFESQPTYNSDIETESNSSLHSDFQPPDYFINQSFSNYGHSKSSLGYYSTSPRSPILKPNNIYTPSSPSLKRKTSFIPSSPGLKPSSSFIQTSPKLKPSTSFTQTSPKLKPSTSFIQSSPKLKPSTSFIQTSPKLKPTNLRRPSSPTIGKYSSSSLYNKQISHIASPRVGYSTPISPTPYSKNFESRAHDPVSLTYSIKDLINNKTPQTLSHSNSINSVSSISSSSTYKPSSSFSRKNSLEQTPQLKSYLNKMTTQRSKSPSMQSTTSTSSSKYSSGRKTPSSRLGNHYAESTASSTSSSSKVYTKFKSSASSSSLSKLGSGIPTSIERKMSTPMVSHLGDNKSKLSSTYSKTLYSSDIPSSSKISYKNGGYNSRLLSKTPTPSNHNKVSTDSRIPSPSPYSKRSISPFY